MEIDFGQVVVIADDEGEDTDIERLLDQAASTSSPDENVQNSPARVMSIAISTPASQRTSP